VLDVREPGEYAAGHIPGALLIPLGELPDRLHEVPEEGPVVVVCRSGNRSGQALRFLRQQGFDNVHNMLGGMLAWQRAGYEVEK
jgi:rhodanese-related sulfurtransferase